MSVGVTCILGVLTVNLLTPRSFFLFLCFAGHKS